MIKILLDPSVFQYGGLFYGKPMAHAVLHVGSGKPYGEGYTAKAKPIYHDGNLWRGGETQLLIDAWGTEIQNLTLEEYMKNEALRVQFGMVLIDFVQQGIIQVQQDGVALTPTQLNTYVAP